MSVTANLFHKMTSPWNVTGHDAHYETAFTASNVTVSHVYQKLRDYLTNYRWQLAMAVYSDWFRSNGPDTECADRSRTAGGPVYF